MLIHSIPTEILQVIRKIRTVENGAVVAGGCLRDSSRGLPWNDIDVFFHALQYDVTDKVMAILEECQDRDKGLEEWWSPVARLNDRDVYESWSGQIVAVHDFLMDGLNVQLIALSHEVTMKTVCDRIDMGICKIACNGYDMYTHKDYIHDSKNHEFTVDVPSIPYFNLDATMIRAHRFQRKYPGWPLIIKTSAGDLRHDFGETLTCEK